jgi:hypothetical protein
VKYMFLICTEGPVDFEAGPTEETAPEAWVDEMTRRGVREIGERLRPAEDATTVRVRDGELHTTDGPFAETREQICGFDLIDCADLDEAIEIAGKHPMSRFGMIEIRPLWPMSH